MIIVGAHDFGSMRSTLYESVMEQVANGARLIVLENADKWAEQWDNIFGYQCVQYNGIRNYGSGGRLFVGKNALLDGLPQSQAMNWEYQVLYRGRVWGLDIGRNGFETVVACAAQNRKDIVTAVARIPFARGEILVSTLDIMPYLDSMMPQAAMAKRLFLNFVE